MDTTLVIIPAVGTCLYTAYRVADIVSRHLNARHDRELAREAYRDQGTTDALKGYAALLASRSSHPPELRGPSDDHPG